MAIPDFLARVRAKIGNDLIMLPAVSGCVFDDDGRLLLVRPMDARDRWQPPGGILEPGELPEDAVAREIAEETGLEVAVRGLIGVYSGPPHHVIYPNGDEVCYMVAVYGCAPLSGDPRPDREEIAEVRWFPRAAIAGLTMAGWSEAVLADAFRLGYADSHY